LRRIRRHNGVAHNKAKKMDPKLTILFLLIGTIIVLSHLNDENLARVRRQFAIGRWRGFVQLRRKS
jgi:hypothetical protein